MQQQFQIYHVKFTTITSSSAFMASHANHKTIYCIMLLVMVVDFM